MTIVDMTEIFGVIRQAPDLRGARCVGNPAHFELPPRSHADYRAVVTRAVNTCQTCPGLTRCRKYLDAMKPGTEPESMVMAATVLPPRFGRR